MHRNKLVQILFVIFPLALACMGSNCAVPLGGSFDLLDTAISQENAAYDKLINGLAQYNTEIKDFENFYWDVTDTAFMEWKRALEDIADQLPQVESAWNTATQQDKDANQSRYEVARSKMTLILARQVNIRLVYEDWTIYLLTLAKPQWEQAVADVTSASKSFFGQTLPTPNWTVELMKDRDQRFVSGMGLRRWRAHTDTSCEGSGDLARCPLQDKSPIALEAGEGDGYFVTEDYNVTTINLGWTSNTANRNVWFERAPGKTGPLTYNETLALHVKDLGYVYYEHHTIGVSLSASSTPRYEWQITPQWAEMSGQNVDTKLFFGLQNINRPGFLTDCGHQTGGAQYGWVSDPYLVGSDGFDCD